MSEHSTKDSSFPHWVALGSLVFVLAMFFSNTVPALRERQGLAELATELAEKKSDFEEAIGVTGKQARFGSARPGERPGEGPGRNFDLQSLLVAIDEHDLTPHELWEQYGGSLEVDPEVDPEDEDEQEPR